MGEATEAQENRRLVGRVVVGVDGSPAARAALVWALAHAARRGATLRVLSTFPVEMYWADPYLADAGQVDTLRADTVASARALVDEVRADPGISSQPGVREVLVEVVVAAGPPAGYLVRASEDADLLVVGNRGRGMVRSAVLGSVALHSVTHARCPVVVVRPHLGSELTPPRVVVGLDTSAESRAALARAVAEAALIGGEVTAVAAYSAAVYWSDSIVAWAPPAEQLRGDAQSGAERMVAEVLADASPDATPKVQVLAVEGPAGDVLVRQAEGAQLLVVGGRGHGTIRGMLLGSVALHCVIHAPCPVLVVPGERAGAHAG